MRIFKGIPHKLELAILDDSGAFVNGLSISYDVRKCSDNTSVAAGTMSEVVPAYTTTITLNELGDYRVVYVTPTNYENGMENLTVDDYVNYKADVSLLALQATLNDVKARTELLPDVPAAAGDEMTMSPAERLLLIEALLTTADTIETGINFRSSLRAVLATLAGIADGGGTPNQTFSNPAGTDPRVIMKVDIDGNRSSMSILG